MKGTKRLTAAITTLFAAGALAVSASAAAAHNYKGDINRDDKVNITDLVCLNKHFQGISYIPEENIVYADMDGNGRLNVIDFMFLKIAALSDAEPEEIEITAPAETTPAVTTKTTAAATTAVTTKTTAATTKVTTAATTKAATTSTTKAAAVTTTTTASSTNKTSSATTTTTTTSTTTASSAATTTSTTTTTTAPTTTTTTTTTTASEAATSKTYPAKVGNGVNSIAPESADRAFIILGGTNSTCKYDESTNINDFVPGSVQMPEITRDGSYKASFYVYDEGIIDKTGGTFISNTYLRILKAGTWENYTTDDKPDLKITVTKATTDGVERDLSGITQESTGSVNISSVLGTVNNVEIEFTVEGFESTTIAGTNKNRAVITLNNNDLSLGDTDNYTSNLDIFNEAAMPEITGNGNYTAKVSFKEKTVSYYSTFKLLASDGQLLNTKYPNAKITINSVKIDGTSVSDSVVSNLKQENYGTIVPITDLGLSNFDTLEITFTVSGM